MKGLITLVFTVLFLSGCQQFTDEYRFNEFFIQYKNNNNSTIGVLGAVYNDRIY